MSHHTHWWCVINSGPRLEKADTLAEFLLDTSSHLFHDLLFLGLFEDLRDGKLAQEFCLLVNLFVALRQQFFKLLIKATLKSFFLLVIKRISEGLFGWISLSDLFAQFLLKISVELL